MQHDNNEQWRAIATTQSEHEISQGHSFWLWAYRIGIGGSFTALSMFIVERMAGTEAQIWEWTGGQYLNGFIGLIFAFAFSAFIYGFYLTDYSIKQRLFIFSVAVCFPLFAEVSQTMHRGEESQKASSQASPEFLAAQKALDRMTGVNPTSGNAPALAMATGEKARHEAELAACSRYTSAQRREKCERYEQGKIAEAEGKIQGYSTAGNAALNAHKGGITDMIGQIKVLGNNEDHAHAMVKLFMQFGASLLVASLIMAILIIGSIEAALAWLGDHVKNYQKAMRARGLEIGNQKHDVVKVNHGTASPAPMGAALTGFADSAKMTVGEYANKVEQGLKASPEVIANEYARAQHAREQLYKTGADKLENIQQGFNESAKVNGLDMSRIGKVFNPDSEKPEIVETDGFKQSPEQRKTVDRLYQDQMKTYREELREGKAVYYNGPLDEPRHTPPKMSVEQTVKQLQADVKASCVTSPEAIQAAVFDSFASMPNPAPLDDAVLVKIADKIVIKQAHAPAPARPDHQKPGMTGLHNPALGTAEEHYPLPLPTVDRSAEVNPPHLTALVDRSAEVNAGQRDSVNEDALKKVAELEEKLANQEADMLAKKEADRLAAVNASQRAEADRSALEASYKAKLEAEVQERKRAEAAREEADRIAAGQRAEADRIAAGQRAEADRIAAVNAAEQEAVDRAERGSLTDEQIALAVNVIRHAVNVGQLQTLGSPSTGPLLKDAGLPTSSDALKYLSKSACKVLTDEGLCKPNPRAGRGQPLYILA